MTVILTKKIIKTAAAVILMSIFTARTYAYEYKSSDQRIMINGMYRGVNYEKQGESAFVPARQIFESLGARVSWSGRKAVRLEYGGNIVFPEFYIAEGKSYVSARYVTALLGLKAFEYPEINVLSITAEETKADTNTILKRLPKYDGYTQEDLKWLSQIIQAEAGGEPYEAKIAVGNVILNRKQSQMYPNTIKEVIFDQKNGVQFSPTLDGSIYNTPNADSFLAALEVLEGKRNAGKALFFVNPDFAGSSWVADNRTYAFTMENHDFYY